MIWARAKRKTGGGNARKRLYTWHMPGLKPGTAACSARCTVSKIKSNEVPDGDRRCGHCFDRMMRGDYNGHR